MKRLLLLFVAMLLSFTMLGCTDEEAQVSGETKTGENSTQTTGESNAGGNVQDADGDTEKIIAQLVESFGKKLQEVSLQAPADLLNKSMEESYGGLVSPALIEKWQSDPLNAPGRLTSSPWPDRIDIISIEKAAYDEFKIEGEIIEITSTELEKGGACAKRPVTLVVKKTEDDWLINDAAIGSY